MKIALVFLPAWLPYAPPLGISCISATLKELGHEVLLYDLNETIFNKHKDDFSEKWLMTHSHEWESLSKFKSLIYPKIKPQLLSFVKDILMQDIDAIGFSVFSNNAHPTRMVMDMISKLAPDLKIFYGGPRISEEYAIKDLEQRRVSAAIIGEGEESVKELVSYWSNGTPITDKIPGVITRDHNDEILIGGTRPLLNMKKLPMPDFSQFNFDGYTQKSIAIEFGRGCVANCSFCSETNYWVSFRLKSPRQILNEIKFCIDNYGVHDIRIVDSLMNGNHRHLEELCDLIIFEKIKITWNGFCRIDKKLTDELLDKMYRAGCLTIIFGIESGSQNVLNLMNKNVAVEDIYSTVKRVNNSGIQVHSQILIGYPGETWFNFFETLLMLFRLKGLFHRIYPGIPLVIDQGSDIALNPAKYGIVKTDMIEWRTKYFSNTYFIRKIRQRVLRFVLAVLKINQGFPLVF